MFTFTGSRKSQRTQRSQIWCQFRLNSPKNGAANWKKEREKKNTRTWSNKVSWDLITRLLKDYSQDTSRMHQWLWAHHRSFRWGTWLPFPSPVCAHRVTLNEPRSIRPYHFHPLSFFFLSVGTLCLAQKSFGFGEIRSHDTLFDHVLVF